MHVEINIFKYKTCSNQYQNFEITYKYVLLICAIKLEGSIRKLTGKSPNV